MSCVPIIGYISIVHSNDTAFVRREKKYFEFRAMDLIG